MNQRHPHLKPLPDLKKAASGASGAFGKPVILRIFLVKYSVVLTEVGERKV